jgi:hypothetical protein
VWLAVDMHDQRNTISWEGLDTAVYLTYTLYASDAIGRHSQVVRRRSAKPLFPSSNLGAASIYLQHSNVRKDVGK